MIDSKNDSRQLKIYTASLISGTISDLILHPIDTIKNRQQARRDKILSFWRSFNSRRGILNNLYKGYASVFTFGLFINPIYYGAYTILKEELSKSFKLSSVQSQIAATSLAELIISSIGVPETIIKKRLQVLDTNYTKSNIYGLRWFTPKTIPLAKSIIQQEGIMAYIVDI